MKSAIEVELEKAIRSLARVGSTHDRAVLIGLILSLTPFPPSNLIGLLLDALNLGLIARGLLSRNELSMVIVSICFASFNLLIFFIFLGWIQPELTGLWHHFTYVIHNFLPNLYLGLLTPEGHATAVQHV